MQIIAIGQINTKCNFVNQFDWAKIVRSRILQAEIIGIEEKIFVIAEIKKKIDVIAKTRKRILTTICK